MTERCRSTEGDESAFQNGSTLAFRAATVLERAILTGELPANSRLVLPRLSARYGVGITPIREALSRLVSRDS
jgi:GntR family carbon starvation induced transcriptional regulator